MLLKQETLRGIENGSITVAFRRWRRPTVKTGGTLLTPIGQLAVEAVDVVSIYRVRLSLAGPDPRIALREEIPEGAELESILQRLGRLDARGASGPWTCGVLKILRERPAERAAELARAFGMDKAAFKANVRKLKGLGLTESLRVGYRLSPRGKAVLSELGDCPDLSDRASR